jgi:ribonuclease P protein component
VRLEKAARLRRRREYLAVQDRGRRVPAGELVVLALPGVGGRPRIGITVSTRVANAVVRNRIKRWVREAFRSVAGELPPVDLVVVARPGAERVGLEGARAALRAAVAHLAGAGGGR